MSQVEASSPKADNARCLWGKLRSVSFTLLGFKSTPVAVTKNTFLTLQLHDIRRCFHRGYTGPARIESTGDAMLEDCDHDLWKRCSKRRFSQAETCISDDDTTSIISIESSSNVTDDGFEPMESIRTSRNSNTSELNAVDEVCSMASLSLREIDSCRVLANTTMYESETSVEAATQKTTMSKIHTSALVKGESEVRYSDNEIAFQWSVDLRTAHTSHRCGFQRRFNIHIEGQDVPFVFHIDPIAKEHVNTDKSHLGTDKPWAKKKNDKSTFRRPGTYAHLWLRCADTDMLPADNCCLSVSISGGGDMHHISESHDFVEHPACNQVVPDTAEELWQIPFDIDKHSSWQVSGVFQLAQRTETGTSPCGTENGDHNTAVSKSQLPAVPCSVLDVAEEFVVKNTFLCLKGQDDQPPLMKCHSAPTSS